MFTEQFQIGVRWDNLTDGIVTELSFAWILTMLFLDGILYFIIGWYFHTVLNGKGRFNVSNFEPEQIKDVGFLPYTHAVLSFKSFNYIYSASRTIRNVFAGCLWKILELVLNFGGDKSKFVWIQSKHRKQAGLTINSEKGIVWLGRLIFCGIICSIVVMKQRTCNQRHNESQFRSHSEGHCMNFH